MGNKLPIMPLNCEALMSSRRVRAMKLDEFGAYMKLLAEAWLDGARLPIDVEEIRREILGIEDDQQWRRVQKFVIEKMFVLSEDGQSLVNLKQLDIWRGALETHTRRSNAGKVGIEAKLSRAEAGLKPGLSQPEVLLKHKIKENKIILSPPIVGDINTRENDDGELPLVVLEPKPKPAPTEPAKRFVKPTVEEVAAYCRERGSSVDAAKFVDYYQSKGWLVGKSPMKDWRAAVRTWEGTAGWKQAEPAPTLEDRAKTWRAG